MYTLTIVEKKKYFSSLQYIRMGGKNINFENQKKKIYFYKNKK